MTGPYYKRFQLTAQLKCASSTGTGVFSNIITVHSDYKKYMNVYL